ncbi:MAG: ABC transporter substrate-binding protein [Candidatus Peregrinibacteria bacterium]
MPGERQEIKIKSAQPERGASVFKWLMYSVFIVAFAWVSGRLFFDKQIADFLEGMGGKGGEEAQIEVLRVIYPDEPTSLDPLLTDPTARQRLVNIFEPLVKMDENLNVKPALAVSWGMLDDLTWRFELRRGVKFHDGTEFSAQDAVSSIEKADVMIATVDHMDVKDNLLTVVTKNPDPLLLQKLSSVLISPVGSADLPVGTGPYMVIDWEWGETFALHSFDEYWGGIPKFKTVELLPVKDKSERVRKLFDGEADILTFVPYEAVELVESKGFEVVSIPTLEVQFLVMNSESGILSDREMREAVSESLDIDVLTEKIGGFARPVSQFVSNGIFGFNPDISEHKNDVSRAGRYEGEVVQIHLPLGLDVLGEFLRESLGEIGLAAVVSYMDGAQYLDSIQAGKADMYFLAFKSELGDASDFLKTIVKSDGDYNIFGYKNENVDYLTELSLVELDENKRRDALQEAMEIVVDEDIVGVPLFEYETVMSFAGGVKIKPRIDGLLYFEDL